MTEARPVRIAYADGARDDVFVAPLPGGRLSASVDLEGVLAIADEATGATLAMFARGAWSSAVVADPEPEPEDTPAPSEALAEWERELLAAAEPAPTVWAVGDVGRIRQPGGKWDGFPVQVERIDGEGRPSWLFPLGERPDTCGRAGFYWTPSEVERLGAPTPVAHREPCEGDLVLVAGGAKGATDGTSTPPAFSAGPTLATIDDERDPDGDVYVREDVPGGSYGNGDTYARTRFVDVAFVQVIA